MTRQKIYYLIAGVVAAAVFVAGILQFAPTAKAVAISNLTVTSVTNTSATISWTTDVPADAVVEFGPNNTIIDAQEDPNMKTSHSLLLLGLSPGTKYIFKASSADSGGEVTYANDGTFTTTGSPASVLPPYTPPAPAKNTSPPPAAQAPPPPLAPPAAVAPPPPSYTAPPTFTPPPPPASQQPLYPTGTLALQNGVIYFIIGKENVKIPFTSMQAFHGLGYKLENVISIDVSTLRSSESYFLSTANQEHPWGSCLVWKDGTVYYHAKQGMIGIPSIEVAYSIGCSPDKIVPMNRADELVWEANPNIPPMQMNDAWAL